MGIERTLFFLPEHTAQRRDGTNAPVPRLSLESESHVFGAKLNRWKLEKIPREYELQIREQVVFSSAKMEATDLDPSERLILVSDHTGYAFLNGDVERTGRTGEGVCAHESVE